MKLQYIDFAKDEFTYLQMTYINGFRFNAMVSQAQRICECYLKQVIANTLVTNTDAMVSHNLRTIYDYITDMGIDIREIRGQVMLLNNYYNHTRYPGRDSFLAGHEDVEASYKAICEVISYLTNNQLKGY